MLIYIATAAREARLLKKRRETHIAAAADVGEITIKRFERAEAWPRELDRILDAYAKQTGVDAFLLWREALGQWTASRKQGGGRR